ncbi:hypothetical protein DM02DRAFT_658545 [Periconia macrospinosa]|uniref:Uncharacterized protein n=1 Tax=Periconia macrospinosa TaxID=97972 RepID=A0A2V1DG80_9PLEO|nr:hypothetical protein DM02DRAFT_658545 [Periconia macrospinosa]
MAPRSKKNKNFESKGYVLGTGDVVGSAARPPRDEDDEYEHTDPIRATVEEEEDEDSDTADPSQSTEVKEDDHGKPGDKEEIDSETGKIKVIKGQGVVDEEAILRNVRSDINRTNSIKRGAAALANIIRRREKDNGDGQTVHNFSDNLNNNLKRFKKSEDRYEECLVGSFTQDGEFIGDPKSQPQPDYHPDCTCEICKTRKENDVARQDLVKNERKARAAAREQVKRGNFQGEGHHL